MRHGRTNRFSLSGALLLFTIAAAVCAQAQGNCSLATLNGSYGFFGQGTVVTEPPMRLVTSGIIKYDGNGNLSGESMNNVEGWGAVGDTLVGTYTVSPDCIVTGEHTSPSGETLHFVGTISNAGTSQEIHFVLTDPGFVALGTSRKMPPGGCSLATLRGPYALFGEGVVTASTPPALIAHAGVVTYDGMGAFAGSDTITLNGSTLSDTFAGTYAVTADCTISVEINSTIVGVVHEFGRITGEGKSREVHLIISDPGFMFLETTKQQ